MEGTVQQFRASKIKQLEVYEDNAAIQHSFYTLRNEISYLTIPLLRRERPLDLRVGGRTRLKISLILLLPPLLYHSHTLITFIYSYENKFVTVCVSECVGLYIEWYITL